MNTAATAPQAMAATDSPDSSKIIPFHADYFEQILPTPPVICGLSLKPLSIGRYRRMARLNCAFVAETPSEATAGDLLIGVLICSMRCDDFDEFYNHSGFKKQAERWGRKFGFFPPRYFSWPIIGQWLKNLFGRAVDEADAVYLLEQMQLFKRYIEAGSKAPPYWDESPNERVSGAHWSQSIEATLREFQGWTKAEIEEEPLTKALWDFFKHMENAGMVRLCTSDEQKELEKPLTPEQEKGVEEWLKMVEAAKTKKPAAPDKEAVPNGA